MSSYPGCQGMSVIHPSKLFYIEITYALPATSDSALNTTNDPVLMEVTFWCEYKHYEFMDMDLILHSLLPNLFVLIHNIFHLP